MAKSKNSPRTKKSSLSNGVSKKGAAKKKPAKKKAGAKLRKNQNPHPRKLTGKLLSDLRAASYKLQMKNAQADALEKELNAFSMDSVHAPIFMALAKQKLLVGETKEAIEEFVVVQKMLAAKYKIPIEELHLYTFDTETGGVTYSGAPQN